MARRRRQKESFIDVLFGLPWQVSVVLGVVAFIGLKWLMPSMLSSNAMLKPMAIAFSGLSWLISGGFLLIGLFVFVTQKIAAIKAGTTASDPSSQGLPKASWLPSATKKSSQSVRTEPTRALDEFLGPSTDIAPEKAEKPSIWSIELIRDIEWKRFEDVCQKFYELKGIRSETTPLGPDGGIDIRLYQDDSGLATSIVQCKAWGKRFVGVQPVRELLGVMTHEKIVKAFFMISGRYSDEAKEVAKSNRITLIDGEMLLMMIQRLSSESQKILLAFATEGDYSTPTCPSCGVKMKRNPGKSNRPDFWGCQNYRRCHQKPWPCRKES